MLQNAEEIRTPQNSGKSTSFMWSRSIVVSVVPRLRTGRLGVPIPAGRRDVISSPKRPDRSGAQSTPYSMVTRRGLEAGRLLTFSAEVKNEWGYNSTPPFTARIGITLTLTSLHHPEK